VLRFVCLRKGGGALVVVVVVVVGEEKFDAFGKLFKD